MIEVKERPKSRSGNTALHIRKIGVIGAGQMGSGIAHVSALAGFDVKLNDLSADRIKAGIDRSTRCPDRGTQLVGDRLDIFSEVLSTLHGPPARNDDLRRSELGALRFG